ncbi:MAG: FtsX-like permease family protein [Telluria sp.]
MAKPGDEDRVRDALSAVLRNQKLSSSVIRADVLSGRYRSARRLANAELGLAGLALLVFAGAISFWAAAVNGKRRRRELVVLRSFGLQRRGITAHVMAEGILVAIGAVVLAAMLGSTTSWLAEELGWRLPVELDPLRLLGTMAALLGVTIAAAAIPALRAADAK